MKISKGIVKHNILKAGSKNLSYENWKVFNNEGRHMFTCGEKKANWYLDRNLAEIIGVKSIKLTFNPKGYGFDDDEEFGRSFRESICVVIGISDGLQRHHIVPYCYRSYFPTAFKSKNHHDVVLINWEKHAEYEQHANEFKDYIALKYGVKTIAECNIDYVNALHNIGRDDSMLIAVIHSLFTSFDILSNDVKLEKLHYIAENTNIPFEKIYSYNYLQLYKIYLYLKEKHNEDIRNFKKLNRNLYDHGYHIVQKLDTDEKIEDFVKLWRYHFLITMHPKFMPTGWSVDFRIKTNIL